MKYPIAFIFSLAIIIQICNGQSTIKAGSKNTLPAPKRVNAGMQKEKKVINQVFVINPNGISGYMHKNDKIEYVHFNYGEKLGVIAISGDWYFVTNYLDHVYVRKSATVVETQIGLTDADLNEAYYNDTLGHPEKFSNIHIKLISKAQFEKMKATAVNYFDADTGRVKKVNGTFSLLIGKKLKRFTDNEDYDGENNYIGQFKFLNSYIVDVGSDEAEHSLFVLINKTTGKSKFRFPAMPYFSVDKKFSICIDALDWDMADVYVYKNYKDGNSDYAFGRYKNWLPADTYDQFWGTDGCFYLPVLPKMCYRDRYNNPMHYPELYNCRYVRIQITVPSPPRF